MNRLNLVTMWMIIIRKKRRPAIWWNAIKESLNSNANRKTLDNIIINPNVVKAVILFFWIMLHFMSDLVSCQCCAMWININISHIEAPIQWGEVHVFPVPLRPAMPINNRISTINLDCFDKKSFFIFHLTWIIYHCLFVLSTNDNALNLQARTQSLQAVQFCGFWIAIRTPSSSLTIANTLRRHFLIQTLHFVHLSGSG